MAARCDRVFLVALAAIVAIGCSSGEPPPEPTAVTLSLAERLPAAIGPRPTGLATAAVRSNLRARALFFAQRAGAAAPARMVAVAAADHQAAETEISGAVVDDHVPVYVVQMSGATFTATRHPPGVPAPTGHVLTVTFDAATMNVLDVGYDELAPNLARIDAVEPVDLGAAQ